MKKVLDYIGVGWRPGDLETEILGQMNIADFPEVLPDGGGEK